MDIDYWVSLFNDDTAHPCLVNAISLAACSSAGGRFAEFEAPLLERTRHHMYACLEYADRLTHFLWASVILASYYRQNARLLEASTTIATAVRFAMACGLPGLHRIASEDASIPLLPEPTTQDEYDDRVRQVMQGELHAFPANLHARLYRLIRLSHALYMADRCFTSCTGWPSSLPTINRLPFYSSMRDEAAHYIEQSPHLTVSRSHYV